MGIKDTYFLVKDSLEKLNLEIIETTSNGPRVSNLIPYRTGLAQLSEISVFSPVVANYKSKLPTALLDGISNKIYISANDVITVRSMDSEIKRIGNIFISLFTQDYYAKDDVLNIKLPQLNDFADLEKIANELKKAIEVPLNASNIEGAEVKIMTAEPGSIWLVVGLGALQAVKLIGRICNIATTFRGDLAKAKQQEEYLRQLKINNDMLEDLRGRAEIYNNELLEGYAKQVEDGSADNQELLSIYKLSIKSFAEMMDKGALFLPETKDQETKKLFPQIGILNTSKANGRIEDGKQH